MVSSCFSATASVTGPIADLGYSPGYYGHHDWWLGASWSAGA